MVPETERIIDGHMNTHDFAGSSEPAHENGLRPQSFEDFPGQDVVKAKLRVFVEAAKARQEPLDHVLLHGPPGWVKPLWPISWPIRWGLKLESRPGLRWTAKVI